LGSESRTSNNAVSPGTTVRRLLCTSESPISNPNPNPNPNPNHTKPQIQLSDVYLHQVDV